MGVVLIVVGGFLLGGAMSLWRQAGSDGAEVARIRQLRGAAAVLGVAALLALAAGALRAV